MSPEPRRRPTGRRPGEATTREALLDAASRQFAEHGYDGASLRAIAADAGVDPGMVRHFFGGKNGLFLATLAAGDEIQTALSTAFLGPPAQVGRRAVGVVLTLWEQEPTATTLRALFRSAVASSSGVPGFAEIMAPHVFTTLGATPDPRVMRHVALAGTQMLGVAIGRYVLGLEPLVRMSHDEVIEAVAPAIQPHLEQVLALTGRVPAAPA